jgi:hypothetical protein
MSIRQYGYLVGFLFIWAVWLIGFWQALLALLVGLVTYVIARGMEGDLDFSDLSDRFPARRQGGL